MTELLEALDIDGGIVAAIGAGGKKSLLYAIAAASRGRVAWTATKSNGSVGSAYHAMS